MSIIKILNRKFGLRPRLVQLLIVQPTPFCNIQCDYCYLPNRDSSARLTPETFRGILIKVFGSGLVGPELSIVWHAGEPMALPIKCYSELFKVADELGTTKARLKHSMQTNGLLVTEEWCSFIQSNKIQMGVSIDGPAFLHDRHRKDRLGRGTHARVMRGVDLLRRSNIAFHVIAVITADALDYADEIFGFFVSLGIDRLGFNVEELEGVHGTSSLIGDALEDRIRSFWKRLYELQQATRSPLRIREFEQATQNILHSHTFASSEQSISQSSQLAPLGIISVDWRGNISSFSRSCWE